MANMSNGFYMGQQGFATQQSGYGQAAGHQQQYGNMFTSQQQTQEMIQPNFLIIERTVLYHRIFKKHG